MVFLTEKFMFIVIHKCASRSVLSVLKKHCEEKNIKILRDGIRSNYNSISHIKDNNFNFANDHAYFASLWHNKYKTTYTFAIIRNPYQRFLSSYKYVLKNNWFSSSLEEFTEKTAYLLSLNIDNRKILKKNDKWILHHIIPQYKYITINDEIVIDKLIKLENINSEFIELKKKLNLNDNLSFPCLNFTSSNIMLNNNICDKIHKIYEKDFILLNYNRNSWS